MAAKCWTHRAFSPDRGALKSWLTSAQTWRAKRPGTGDIDLLTGVYASTATLATLRVRDRTGKGQHMEMALLDVGMAVLANRMSTFIGSNIVPSREGNTHPSLAPCQDFPTRDGAMLLAIGNDGQFQRF